MSKTIVFALALIAFRVVAAPRSEAREDIDVIPIPKRMSWGKGTLDISNARIVLTEKTRQMEIAAEEINRRIKELGASPLAIVIADTDAVSVGVGSPLVRVSRNAAVLDRASAARPQGYQIRFVRENAGENVFLMGVDTVGAMYAAITFRGLIEKCGERLVVRRVDIDDWPDFKYRYVSPFRVFKATKDETVESVAKKYIDWLFLLKVNVFGAKNLRDFPESVEKSVNDYARERGMLAFGVFPDDDGKSLLAVGRVGHVPAKQKDRYEKMVKAKGDYYCWSADDLLRAKVERVADYCVRRRINCVLLHPVDGGGLLNPELWEYRCDDCRKRFGDNRGAADAYSIGVCSAVLRERVPDLTLFALPYPYTPLSYDFETAKKSYPKITRELWRKNVIDYLRELTVRLPNNIYLGYWFGARGLMEAIISHRQKKQPMGVYFEYLFPGYLGYVCASVRYVKTDYFEGMDQFVWSAGNRRFVPVQEALDAQFYWNVNSPGAAEFPANETRYYTAFADDRGPSAIFAELVPKICRTVWGAKAGTALTEMFSHGLNPMVVLNEKLLFDRLNRSYPPNAKLSFGEDEANQQFEAANKAWIAMEKLIADMKTPPANRSWPSRFIAHYYKEAALLRAIAGAKYYLLASKNARDAGNDTRSLEIAKDAAAFLRIAQIKIADAERKTTAWPDLGETAAYYRAEEELTAYARVFATTGEKMEREKKLTVAPKKLGDKIRVAIYNASLDKGKSVGHEAVKQILDATKDIQAEYIKDLALTTLLDYDCLVFPQSVTGITTDKEDYYRAIRVFVEKGGRGVLFYHDACGFKRGEFGEKTTFPEICVKGDAGAWKDNKCLIVNAFTEKNRYSRGQIYEHAYQDHILIEPGPAATVVMSDRDGKPIAVRGEIGCGRVIYDGTILFEGHNQTPIPDFDKTRLLDAIYWLTTKLEARGK